MKAKKENTPLLTIGMPVYNGEKYIEEALKSILAQTYKEFKLIISDNASTDNTRSICEKYAAKDKRIEYHRYNENKGAAWNFNNTLTFANTKYFKWAAHDDNLTPEFLEKCIDILERDDSIIMAYTRAILIDEKGYVSGKHTDKMHLPQRKASERYKAFHEAYRGHHWCNPVFGVIRLEPLKKTCLIGDYISSDVILLGELALRGKIHEINGYFLYQRIHEQNSTLGHKGVEARTAWFNPKKAGKLHVPRIRWLHEYAKSINKLKARPVEKAKCYASLAKWAYWHRKLLARDIAKTVLWPIIKQIRKYNAMRTPKRARASA